MRARNRLGRLARAAEAVRWPDGTFESAIPHTDYWLQRWIAQMTAVEIHAAWERYVEVCLVVALNHSPEHFLQENKSRYH